MCMSNEITFDNLPEMITTTEIARLFRVSPLTIKRWTKKGHIDYIVINSRGDRRFKRDDVLKLYNKGY